jgi:hypothetical protein
MNETDIKVLLLNATALSISMSQVETALKLLLLVISIGYTAQRWYFLRKKNE